MKKGFTLIEIIVASSLLLVLGAAILGLQYVFSQNSTAAIRSYNNVNQANDVLARFTNEIRKASTSENGAYPFEVMSDNELIFYSDIDFDGLSERVRYTRELNELRRGIIEPVGTPAVYDVQTEKVVLLTEEVLEDGAPIFFYYNSGWPDDTTNNPLPSASRLSDTRMVRIVVTIDEFNLDSFVLPRNL